MAQKTTGLESSGALYPKIDIWRGTYEVSHLIDRSISMPKAISTFPWERYRYIKTIFASQSICAWHSICAAAQESFAPPNYNFTISLLQPIAKISIMSDMVSFNQTRKNNNLAGGYYPPLRWQGIHSRQKIPRNGCVPGNRIISGIRRSR